MAENIQKTQNAQLYFSHNSAQMAFFVRKNCKRLRCFLHKKSRKIWFISIFVLILHPEKEIDFQKRINHNYIKNTNCWNIQKLQKPRRDVGAFCFLLIQELLLPFIFPVFVSFSLVFTKKNAFWTKSTPLSHWNSLSLQMIFVVRYSNRSWNVGCTALHHREDNNFNLTIKWKWSKNFVLLVFCCSARFVRKPTIMK